MIFYKMLVKYKMKSDWLKKRNFWLQKERRFSANVPYLKWLKECSQIRLDNNQNFVFVYLIHN